MRRCRSRRRRRRRRISFFAKVLQGLFRSLDIALFFLLVVHTFLCGFTQGGQKKA